MESSSSNPQNEVKGDEIQLNEDKKDNDKGDTSLGESQENITDPSLEENKNSEKGEIETITNSITDGLLPTSNEINKIEENNDKLDNQDNEHKENDDSIKINDSTDQTSENANLNNEDEKTETTGDNNQSDENANLTSDETKIENNDNDDSKNDNKDDASKENNENHIEEEDIEEDNSNKNDDSMLHFSQTFSDEDVQYAFNQLLENNKLPESSMFPQLLQLIYREKTDAIDNQDYDRAKKLENMITSINRENDNFALSYSITPDNQSRYLNERDSRLHQQLQDTKAKYKVKLDHHTESCEFRLRQLQEKQQKEVNDLKAKYQDPSFLTRFNRPSQQLLNLRRCERKLALAKKYEEARQIKRIADNKQQQEEKEMQEAAQQSMQSEYVKLIEKQKKDLDRLMQFDKKMEKEIKTAKHKEISPIEKAIKQTAIRKANNEAKRPFYSLSSSALASTSPLNAKNYNPELARDVMAKNQTLATPRTMNRIKMLKIRNKVELNVEPIDNSTFAKLEQINARRMKSLLPKL